jgi:cytochrome c oxidase subunit III
VIRDRYSLTNTYQLGVAVGLVSVSAFFIALIVVYSLRIEDEHTWQRFSFPKLLWLSTALLAISSWIFEAARYALRRALVVIYRARMAATLAFAFLFLIAQLASARYMIAQGVVAAGNPHVSAFYVFMGLHGLHLAGGMVWLGVLSLKSRRLSQGTESDLRAHRRLAAAAAMYWHFMGALWIVLFLFLLKWTT